MSKKIAVIVGSLRKESLNRKMALALRSLAPDAFKMEIVEIGSLPLYNEDAEEKVPQEWAAFRQSVQKADAVLFITPEYNRSIPGVLKNAIDVGSRPYGKSVWSKKPAAVISVSPGAIGGFGANHHLRQMLVFLDMPTLQQPEAYIGNAAKMFDESGNISVESSKELLTKFMKSFGEWISKFESK